MERVEWWCWCRWVVYVVDRGMLICLFEELYDVCSFSVGEGKVVKR